MIRRIFVLCVPVLLISLPMVAAAAEPQSKASSDDAAQLKAAQKAAQDERIKVLAQVVEILTAQYRVATVDFGSLSAAEDELCNAQLELTNDPNKRITLLTKQLDRASEFLKITQGRFESGTLTQLDVLRAKSHCLEIKIKLLRERRRWKKKNEELSAKPPTTRPSTGMHPLGSHLMVDRYGTIWDDGWPVGTWGVDSPLLNLSLPSPPPIPQPPPASYNQR